jgi:hypothetical protein
MLGDLLSVVLALVAFALLYAIVWGLERARRRRACASAYRDVISPATDRCGSRR